MSHWMETHRGVVLPCHCDQYGHFNVRWYAHAFDDATFHLWNRAGVDQPALVARGIAMVTARNTVNFKRELTAGDLFVVESGITRVGGKSLGHLHRMRNANTGELCATMDWVDVFFDTGARTSTAMPAELRVALSAKVLGEADLDED